MLADVAVVRGSGAAPVLRGAEGDEKGESAVAELAEADIAAATEEEEDAEIAASLVSFFGILYALWNSHE